MKRTIILLLACMAFSPVQQEKKYSVTMTIGEWQKLVTIIHNAPVVGSERDPIINTIQNQINSQIDAENKASQKTIQDSIPTKKPGGKK